MAIVLGNSTAAYRGTGATSHTFAFDVGAGTNNDLSLFIRCFDGDYVSGVTYNGVAMSQVNKVQQGATADYGYMYHLTAPATGSNNFVVSLSSSSRINWAALNCTGVLQTGQPEAQNSAGGSGTASTVSTTSVTNNSLIIYGYVHNAASTDSYTNVTQTAVDTTNGTVGIGYNLKVTAGALSQAANWTGAQAFTANTKVISPSPSVATLATSLMMGI